MFPCVGKWSLTSLSPRAQSRGLPFVKRCRVWKSSKQATSTPTDPTRRLADRRLGSPDAVASIGRTARGRCGTYGCGSPLHSLHYISIVPSLHGRDVLADSVPGCAGRARLKGGSVRVRSDIGSFTD